MSTDPSAVRAVIAQFLETANKAVDGASDETGLYAGGLELDSLEAAELSAVLEDEFGSDPFSAAYDAGEGMPDTVGEIVAFYAAASNA